MNCYKTYHEIKSQTIAWKNAIDVCENSSQDLLFLLNKFDHVLFTGCGSTYYLSLAAAALFQKATGKIAQAVPAGELYLNTDSYLGHGQQYLLVAVSRSGTTTETLKAVNKFKTGQFGEVIVITNYDTDLARLGKINLVIPEGQEESVAQTKSFASMYMATTVLSAVAAGRSDWLASMKTLPSLGIKLMDSYEDLAKVLGADLDFDRFYFLGSGQNYGLACEANLKMKEMTLTHSEPFHFLEFRHGPMSMVNKNTEVVGFLSDKNFEHEKSVLNEMRSKGARILALAESSGDVVFTSNLPEEIRGVLFLPILQLTAFYRSVAKGLNPDQPKNLTAVVKLTL